MLTNITKHWKTTLLGAGLAIGQVLLNGRDGKSLALAIITALLGAFSKDPNSTH